MKILKKNINTNFFVLIFSLLACIQLDAQSPLWIYGNQVVDFSGSYPLVSSLPQPVLGPLEHRYHGQIAHTSQTIQCDKNGNILFFIIDGSIYNKNGYLIASGVQLTYNSVIDSDQFVSYKSKVGVTNIPGFCNLYFLFTAMPKTSLSTVDELSVAVLDVSAVNPYNESYGEKGKLLSQQELFQLYGSSTLLSSLDNIDVFSQSEQLFRINTGFGKSSIELMEIIEISENEKILIYGGKNDGVELLKIDSSSIFVLDDLSFPSGGGGVFDEYGGMECGIKPNGEIVFAIPSKIGQEQVLTNGAFVKVGLLSQISNQSAISEVDISSILDDEAIDFEFTNSCQYLWYTKNSSPYIGAIDMNTLDSISVPFGADTLFAKADIEIQKHGSNYVIFASTSAGFVEISNIENPAQSAMSFNTIAGLNFPNTYADYFYTIQSQNCNYSVLQNFLQSGTCCRAELEQNTSGTSLITNLNDGNWNISNPIENGSNIIHVMQNLVFQTGTTTVISDLTFEFDHDANLIIQKGATVQFNRCKLTSLNCNPGMWPGINLLGTTNIFNTIDQVPAFGGDQGNLILDNCILENASIGIEVGTSSANGGGIVRGTNTKFRNNAKDVYFTKFHFKNSNGSYAVNKSSFANCEFVTDNQIYTLSSEGIIHADLNDVDFIKFANCSFLNKTSINTYDWMKRGKGIYAKRASFTISGANNPWNELPNDLSNTTFYKLTHGIKSIGNYKPTSAFVCKKQCFQKCMYGISAIATPNAQIYLNDFTIPDAAGFSSNDVVERGVHLSSCTGFLLEQNSFEGLNDPSVNDEFPGALGVWIQNSGDNANEVRNNDFSFLKLGTLVQGNNEDFIPNVNGVTDFNPGTDHTGLQWLCNSNESNSTDIYLDANSKIRWIQGGTVMGIDNSPAGNKFSTELCLLPCEDFVVNAENNFSTSYISNVEEYYDPDYISLSSNVSGLFLLSQIYSNIPQSDNSCDDVFNSLGQLNSPSTQGADLNQVQAELETIRTLYKNLVNSNEGEEIITLLNEAYPHESQFYSDFLEERFPLSDSVMKVLINASERLNPFQLTEILLANSPLRREMIWFLEESSVLSEFFMSFIYQANVGVSSRTLMEINITELATRRDHIIRDLAWQTFQSDSLQITDVNEYLEVSDYMSLIAPESSTMFSKLGSSMYLENGDVMSALSTLNSDTRLDTWIWIVENFFDTAQVTPIQDSSLRYKLWEIAMDDVNPENGIAWGLLQENGFTSDEPAPNFPKESRISMRNIQPENKIQRDLMTISPNPSNGISWITYPIEADQGGSISIFDSQGGLIHKTLLHHGGMLELNLNKYSEGLYLLQLEMLDRQLETTKLNIIK